MRNIIIFIILSVIACICEHEKPVPTNMPYMPKEYTDHPKLGPADVGLVYDEETGEWYYPENE